MNEIKSVNVENVYISSPGEKSGISLSRRFNSNFPEDRLVHMRAYRVEDIRDHPGSIMKIGCPASQTSWKKVYIQELNHIFHERAA